MRANTLKYSEDVIRLSVVRKDTKTAWSAYVRGRWPTNCQAMVEREWSLTPGRANGVVWGHVTQNTIDQILAHKRGGIGVALSVLALQFGASVDALIIQFIEDRIQGATRERARFDAEARRLVALAGLARGAGSSRGDRASRLVLHQGRRRADASDDVAG